MKLHHFETYLSAVSNAVVMVAAAVGAYAALTAMRTWKQQQSWNQDHVLARQVLKQLYILRTTSNDLKNTASLIDTKVLHRLERVFTEEERLKFAAYSVKLKDAIEAFESSKPEVMTKLAEAKFIWGKPFDELSQKVALEASQLSLAAKSRSFLIDYPESSVENYPNYFQSSQSNCLIYTANIESERSAIQTALNSFEDALKPRLGRRS